jgi:hypothetical protein
LRGRAGTRTIAAYATHAHRGPTWRRNGPQENTSMAYQVTVAFRGGKEYEIRLLDSDLIGLSRDRAHLWLDEEWSALECEPMNPMGKILLLDKILGIAKYAGEKRFAEDIDWARQFGRCVALMLDRPAIRVDVAGLRVG